VTKDAASQNPGKLHIR